MIEIALKDIKKYYGASEVLKNITVEINTGDKLGIIGSNGTGKTTILKIIAGHEGQDGGMLSIRKGTAIGYLDQIPVVDAHMKVIDVLNSAFEQVYNIKHRMGILEGYMKEESGDRLDKIMMEYGRLITDFERMDGYSIEEKVNRICGGLKISNQFQNRYFNTLSGGEKTTVLLGKILLQSPDILLLDEPTNHLDIDSVEWLEDFIKNYKGTVLIISHDRYFLDHTVTSIIEIEKGTASSFKGTYTDYVKEKKQLIQEQLEDYKTQQKKIKNMEAAIRRFRDWGTRADNESMFKKAENMRKRIEKMEKVERPVLEKHKIQLEFSDNVNNSQDIILINNLEKRVGDKLLFHDLEFYVKNKEKIALLGKNGCGKTTLLKMIISKSTPENGAIQIGNSVRMGYLEQDIQFENEEYTVLETVSRELMLPEGKTRGVLAKFLFKGNDVFKKVKNLSGGEKTRLRLCILMYTDMDLLILDEPTNHLDIDAREMLEIALSDFQGTIVFVSHDRYFINKLASRVIELHDGKIFNYWGNYDYYKQKKKENREAMDLLVSKEKKCIKTEQSNFDEKNKEKELAKIEKNIELLEIKIKEKEAEIERNSYDFENLDKILQEKLSLDLELEQLMKAWLENMEM
ncbi:MAG: ribosomal protection-like ABC-F family protein [Bacillota bacterium]